MGTIAGTLVMSNTWTLNSTNFAELEFKALLGRPGLGFYRLIAQVDVTTHGKKQGEEVTVTNIDGELCVSGKHKQEHYLGHLRRPGIESPITTFQHTHKGNTDLEVELDARRVEAIERVRLGEDLSFKLNLHGVASVASERNPQPVTVTLQYRANQSTWTEILEQMGYRKTMLLEIPVLGDGVSPTFPEAAEHLHTAQTHLLQGRFRDAVGACRDVMESLSIALNEDAGPLPETIKAWFENTRGMNKEERLHIVRRALKLLTHPARHADEVSTSMEWGPEDARSVIIMTATLLCLAVGRE